MFVTVFAAALVYGGVLAYALLFDDSSTFEERRVLAAVVLSAFVAPVLAMWLTAETLNALRRRRLFVRGSGSPRWKRATLGLLIGAVGITIGTILLALLDSRVPDAPIMALGAMIPTLIVFAFLPRLKRGRCVRCQYDLSGMTTAAGGKCPECGVVVMRAG